MQCCDSHKTDLSFKDSYKQGFKVSPEKLSYLHLQAKCPRLSLSQFITQTRKDAKKLRLLLQRPLQEAYIIGQEGGEAWMPSLLTGWEQSRKSHLPFNSPLLASEQISNINSAFHVAGMYHPVAIRMHWFLLSQASGSFLGYFFVFLF